MKEQKVQGEKTRKDKMGMKQDKKRTINCRTVSQKQQWLQRQY